MSRVAVGWGENTVGQSAPSEPAACFVGGRISERVEKKRGSHGAGFRVAGPSRGSGSTDTSQGALFTIFEREVSVNSSNDLFLIP